MNEYKQFNIENLNNIIKNIFLMEINNFELIRTKIIEEKIIFNYNKNKQKLSNLYPYKLNNISFNKIITIFNYILKKYNYRFYKKEYTCQKKKLYKYFILNFDEYDKIKNKKLYKLNKNIVLNFN